MTGRRKPRQVRSDFGGEDWHLLKMRRIGRDYPCGDENWPDALFFLSFPSPFAVACTPGPTSLTVRAEPGGDAPRSIQR
jgi:hypothetical protein